MVRDYEAAGILPAFCPTCSTNTYSSKAHVPERFTLVAIDEGHCVTRELFEQALATARSKPPQYGGAMDEHGIGYVVRQLSEPFAASRDRIVAEVNGSGIDLTHEVMAIPGGMLPATDDSRHEREIVDLGIASFAVDRLSLVDLYGMTLNEADAVVNWLHNRFEANVRKACDRMDVAHVSALLRSPDATQALVEGGVRIENPRTGESMARNPTTNAITCLFRPLAGAPDVDASDPSVMDWYLLRVASDDNLRVNTEDAIALAHSEDGPMAELREQARTAYLQDLWLTTRSRREAIPSRVRAADSLATREVPTARGYRLRVECQEAKLRAVSHMDSTPPAMERVE